MEALFAALAAASVPFLAIGAAFWQLGRSQRRREAARARQVTLTDAIHRELGAVAAPVVSARGRHGWRITMPAPLDQPGMVAALVHITVRAFGGARVEIVLTPQDAAAWSHALRPAARERAADVPLAA